MLPLEHIHTNQSLIIAKKIIDMLDKVKRISSSCLHLDYCCCVKSHLIKISNLIEQNKCITFVLPAFPAKSPNRNKTFGSLPDMGERIALHSLNQICNTIQQFYLPGARIIICSDGRVFNDLVKVTNLEVNLYSEAVNKIIKDDLLDNISLFSLDDSYLNKSYDQMRSDLISHFGEPVETLKYNIKHDENARQQFNGIHRFIFEDAISNCGLQSRNQLRNHLKEVTYRVIQRSNAWSYLIEKKFPTAIRLSIHPQLCGSNKIGIMLLKSDSIWATPWHRVPLYSNHEYILVKKQYAENLGAIPIFVNNQFSHYQLKKEEGYYVV